MVCGEWSASLFSHYLNKTDGLHHLPQCSQRSLSVNVFLNTYCTLQMLSFDDHANRSLLHSKPSECESVTEPRIQCS